MVEQKQTRHIISTKEFEQMKKGIVIINTARGAVMDEAALVTALEKGQVWSCGLDVFEEEPKVHSGLVRKFSQVFSLFEYLRRFWSSHPASSISLSPY